MRSAFRRLWRLPTLVGLLLLGLAITFVVFPFTDRARHRRLISWWSAWLVRICGLRVRVSADPAAAALLAAPPLAGQGCLLVANHVSWLDIFLVNQVSAARFVAKSDIAGWPVVGTLVSRVGTVYIERERRRAVQHVLHAVAEHLLKGEPVAVFPEGTTSDGCSLLPFHGNLLQAAIATERPLLPLGIIYRDARGEPSSAASFIGDTTFVESVWRVLGDPAISAELHLLEPMHPGPGIRRHELAQQARERIAARLGLALPLPAPEAAETPPIDLPARSL